MDIAPPDQHHKAPRARKARFGEVTRIVHVERGGSRHAGWIERFRGLAAGGDGGIPIVVALPGAHRLRVGVWLCRWCLVQVPASSGHRLASLTCAPHTFLAVPPTLL